MKVVLILLVFVFAYSIPNPVYVIKNCFEKLYDVNSNSDLLWSVENELLQWKVDEFYEKLDKVDPTLKLKIEECKKAEFKKNKVEEASGSSPRYLG